MSFDFSVISQFYYGYHSLPPEDKHMSLKVFCDGGSFQYYDWGSSSSKNIFIHRSDGHAVEMYDGSIEYWVNGEIYRKTKDYCHAANMDDEVALYWYLKYGDKLPTKIDNV